MVFVLSYKGEGAYFKGEVGERHSKQSREELSNERVMGIGWNILEGRVVRCSKRPVYNRER